MCLSEPLMICPLNRPQRVGAIAVGTALVRRHPGIVFRHAGIGYGRDERD
jgi:hypothetical protein